MGEKTQGGKIREDAGQIWGKSFASPVHPLVYRPGELFKYDNGCSPHDAMQTFTDLNYFKVSLMPKTLLSQPPSS